MRVGIVGSRRRLDKKSVNNLVESLPKGTTIVSGGCSGVDSWAVEKGIEVGFKIIEYLPKLPNKGSPRWKWREAYFARNRKIAQNSDVIYAFVADDRKGGTENTIKHAKQLGVKVILK